MHQEDRVSTPKEDGRTTRPVYHPNLDHLFTNKLDNLEDKTPTHISDFRSNIFFYHII